MAAPPPPPTRLAQILLPSLTAIINSSSWRKPNSKLTHQCKSLIAFLQNDLSVAVTDAAGSNSDPITDASLLPGPLFSGTHQLSIADSESVLSPLILALSIPATAPISLDAVQKLISHSLLHGSADPTSPHPSDRLLSSLVSAICASPPSPSLELLTVKTLLSSVTSTVFRLHGDSLLLAVRTCYDLFLSSRIPVNQTTAKATLIQMLVIVFRRMEADDSTVPVQPIVVADLIDVDKESNPDAGMVVQSFITKIISDIDVVLNPSMAAAPSVTHDGAFESTAMETANPEDLLDSTDKDMLDAKYWEINMYKTAMEGRKEELVGEGEEEEEVRIGNKLRRDAFLVFRALCKLSMKTPPKEALVDPTLMRGKILALELLKILLENAGAVFRTSERFLGAIKQYLCLSLLKNSASTLITVFQLSCSIFMSLVSRFRPGLKAEIGVFFPMIVLRVLENVAQPNFQQKMIVLRFLEKLCVDSQILVDIFINYDCDVHSPNIFERMVSGLFKTAQGAPVGAITTLVPPQDAIMKIEAMKCLVATLRSMGDWMNKQLRIHDPHSHKILEVIEGTSEGGNDLHIVNGHVEESHEGMDSHIETSNGVSGATSFEQRRAYKLELQEGITLFNRKPKKGIEFLIATKKVGDSPEEIAAFLKNTSGLNKTLVGDYLGEREDFSLRVMHAYVDSFDFEGTDFDEAIRAFLQGFRLPGEAQKIDRIMEKFAERYCKCNPNAFSSADTAYVLAYSVIMLNTDAHNPMVKSKMSADDFIRNNRGIDDGKDVPEEYMRSLYARISRNEIKMKEDGLLPQSTLPLNPNRILGLDNILNIVVRKRGEKPMESSDDLIRHMQEQFKEKARKSESVYYAATDVVILSFMIEVCWAPMLAAFSVPLDQSDEEELLVLCLEGFRHAIHVTAVMSMKTQRDAFVTSLGKFTFLHSVSDIKQKNIDAIKAVLSIAEEDGNYLQEAWEHVLMCISRFEHLHLLGEGAPPDATFFAIQQNEMDKSKQAKSVNLPVLKKKGPGQIQFLAGPGRRGSYDSAGVGGHSTGVVTSEQTSNVVSNMLEQIDMSEMNRIFVRSEKLNSAAVVDFVRALCKVSMEELRSTSDPRVFSLTKIVEIAHYNMDRIRLVWSSIWHVLSDFFVTIGCSENLSIAIFAMDSLRQLAMKFLEREELANYNFQNEFLKPFVIVMRKSKRVEIRELIIRCVSQMVLARVNNVKSGWKSMFMVFTTASYDEHKNIVLLAFEITEKIVRDYFPLITETETSTFTDCVNCLIAFTSSRFSKDISLHAIGFLRFCAAKLAEGDLGSSASIKDKDADGSNISSSPRIVKEGKVDGPQFSDKDDHLHLWFPLLAGLSELTFDLRPEIRKSALQVLFDTLRNHGHIFSLPLWEKVFDSILFPIFDYVRHGIDPSTETEGHQSNSDELDQDSWLYETCTLALQLVVDLFVKFYDTVNPLLRKVLMLLTSFMKRPHQSLAGIGIAAFVRLMSNSGSLFSEDKWLEVVLSLKDATAATLPDFSHVSSQTYFEAAVRDGSSDEESEGVTDNESTALNERTLYLAMNEARCRAAVQLLLIQAVMEVYNMFRTRLSAKNTIRLFEAVRVVASHAHEINIDSDLRSKLQQLGSVSQMQDPPLLRLENESYQICLTLLHNIIRDSPSSNADEGAKTSLVDLCREVLQVYLDTAKSSQHVDMESGLRPPRLIPVGSAKRKELAARAPLVVATLQAICGFPSPSFENNLSIFFPLLTSLVSCEHGSSEVQVALSEMLISSIGPILLQSC